MKFTNLKDLLASQEHDDIIKGLIILQKNPQAEFKETVENILENYFEPIIRIIALKTLKIISEYDSQVKDNPVKKGFDSKFQFLSKTKKIMLLKAIKLGKEEFSMDLTDIAEIYYKENNSDVLLHFSDAIVKKFCDRTLCIVRKTGSDGRDCLPESEKSALLLIFMDAVSEINMISNVYMETELECLITAGSFFLWKYCHPMVCRRLQELCRSSKTDLRIIVSNVIKTVKSPQLNGIAEYLASDLNENVRENAVSVSQIDKASFEMNLLKPSDKVISGKLKSLIRNCSLLHEQLSLFKIVNQLNDPSYMEVVSLSLKLQKNPVIISACTRYLGIHSGKEDTGVLLNYLSHQDPRVISNTIEGLSDCSDEGYLKTVNDLLKRNIHHRVSSAAAVVLWKNGETQLAEHFIQNSLKSRNPWVRKAALHAIDMIDSKRHTAFVKSLFDDKVLSISDWARKVFDRLNGPDVAAEKFMDDLIKTGTIPESLLNEKLGIIQDPKIPLYEKKKITSLLKYIVTESNIPEMKDLFEDETINIMLRTDMLISIASVSKDPRAYLVQLLYHPATIIRLTALNLLRDHDCTPYVEEILPVLFDEDDNVVINAAITLYKYAPGNIERKVRNLALSSEPKTRNLAVHSIRSIGSFNLYQIACQLSNDADPEVSLNATAVIDDLSASKGYPRPEYPAAEKKDERPSGNGEIAQQTDELSCDINIFELVNSLNTIRNRTFINQKLSLVEKALDELSIKTILSIMETTENGVLLSSLLPVISRFQHLPEVVNIIRSMIDHKNSWIAAECISSLTSLDQPLFVDALVDKYSDSDNIVRAAILLLFFQNRKYSDAIVKDYILKDKECFIEALNCKKTSKKPDRPAVPVPVEKCQMPMVSSVGVKVIVFILCIGVILYYSYKAVDQISAREDMVKNVIKMPEIPSSPISHTETGPGKPITIKKEEEKKNRNEFSERKIKDKSEKKTGKPDPGPSYTLSEALDAWNKMKSESENPVKDGNSIVQSLKMAYYRGEFLTVENALSQNDFMTADKLFMKVLEHIKNDDVLISPSEGKWMSRDTMDDQILQLIMKNKN